MHRKPNNYIDNAYYQPDSIDRVPLYEGVRVPDGWNTNNVDVIKKFTVTDLTGIASTDHTQSFIDKPEQWQGVNTDFSEAVGEAVTPMLDLPLNNSLAIKDGSGSVTFSRTTSASYIDRNGVLKYAVIDEPRFEKQGLLIEGASVNKMQHSQDFTSGTQLLYYASATQGQTHIDGGTDAVKLAPTSTLNSSFFTRESASISANSVVSASVIVEKTSDTSVVNWVSLSLGLYDRFSTSGRVWFDLTNGVVSTDKFAGTGTLYGKMEDVGAGRWKCSAWGWVKDGISEVVDFTFELRNTLGTYTFPSVDGSGVILHYEQLEQNYLPSSYMKRVTATWTREPDYCKVDFENNAPINTNISFSADFDVHGIMPMNVWQNIISCKVSGNDANKFYALLYKTTGASDTYLDSGTAFGFARHYDDFTNKIQRVLVTGSETENTIFYNGIKTESESNVRTFADATPYINIGGNASAGGMLWGHVSNVKIYNKVFQESEALLV